MATKITATAPITDQGIRLIISECSQQVCYEQHSETHGQYSEGTNLPTVLFGSTEFFPISIHHCSSLCSPSHIIPYTIAAAMSANNINHIVNYSLLHDCCQWAGYLLNVRFPVDVLDLARAAVGHNPTCPTLSGSSTIVPLAVAVAC